MKSLISLVLGVTMGAVASTAAPLLDCPDPAVFRDAADPAPPTPAPPADWSGEAIAVCYALLAEEVRETDTYRAEKILLHAVELAPQNPKVLEAIARFYRIFRGSRGLFAESETYYLLAERAVDDALREARAAGDASTRWLEELRESIVRGRIELNKREGLGVIIPSEPGDAFGLYLGSTIEYGQFPVAHNDLATPARKLLNKPPTSSLDTGDVLREPDRFYQRHRLRIRYGWLPYVDFAWSGVTQRDAITGESLPVEFTDFEMNEWEVALEDSAGLPPVADLFWRLEYRRADVDPDKPGDETHDRGTLSATLTRSFGRIKADLDFLASFATVRPRYGGEDCDHTFALGLSLLHFPKYDEMEDRLIDPRGYEYVIGAVRHTREYGDTDELIQDTLFGGLKFAEVLPRTDFQVLGNFFRNTVKGNLHEDSSNVEINLIVFHRIIDLVNKLKIRQADRAVGLAQWGVSLRYFEDISAGSLDDFESRGAVLGTSLELFSGPLNRSTMILEPIYEVRHYHNLNQVQHMFRLVLRLGF